MGTCARFYFHLSVKILERVYTQTEVLTLRSPSLALLLLRGTSGLEVKLSDRPVSRSDIETLIPECGGSHGGSSESGYSDEEQQGFVSSVVDGQQRQPRRVRWGDLPRRDDEENQAHERVRRETENRNRAAKLSGPTGESESAEETCELLQHLAVSDAFASDGNSLKTSLQSQISQVGLSKKNAAALRNLLKSAGKTRGGAPAVTPGLLEALTRTLTEWRTEDTMR